MRFFLIILLGFFLYSSNLFSSAFERIDIGTRANSMGGSFVAVCNDVTSIYWNSAGLAHLESDELMFSHTSLLGLDAVNYNFLGYARTYVGPGSAGFGWIHLGTKEDVIHGDFREDSFYLSYGMNLFWDISGGFSIKYFTANYDQVKGSAYTVDYGLLYNWYKIVFIGLNYYNANNPRIEWYTETEEIINSDLEFGIFYKMFLNLHLSFEIDHLLKNKKDFEYHIGAQSLIIRDMITLYGGMIVYTKDQVIYTGGMEFQYKKVVIGYSLNHHFDLSLQHTWSIKLLL